jgi:tetratricopeptide (TPR) repeat protein
LLDELDSLARRVAPETPDGDPVLDAAHAQAAAERLRALVAAAKADPDLPAPLLRAAGGFANRHPVTCDLIVWCAERADRPDAVEEATRPAALQGDERAADLYLASLARQRKWEASLDFLTAMDRGTRGNGRRSWRFSRVTPLVELGRGPEALRLLDQLQAQGVQPFVLDLSRANVLTQIGKPKDALKVLEGLLAKSPEPVYARRAQLRQAEASNALRDFPAADAIFEELLDGEPAHGSERALVLNNYAYNLADTGRRLADAEAMLREAVELDRAEARRAGQPEDARGTYLDSLGWVLFRRDKLAEAREVFEKALNSFDGIGDPIVWDHAGDVYARLGDTGKARAAYAKAIELSERTHQGRQHDRRDELKAKLKQLP